MELNKYYVAHSLVQNYYVIDSIYCIICISRYLSNRNENMMHKNIYENGHKSIIYNSKKENNLISSSVK